MRKQEREQFRYWLSTPNAEGPNMEIRLPKGNLAVRIEDYRQLLEAADGVCVTWNGPSNDDFSVRELMEHLAAAIEDLQEVVARLMSMPDPTSQPA